ncbi:hypothetical protein CYMTET_23564 [Cymbomonas tetramitiformis]|uniref:Uncharacterized protein n=1 Tax=Cymbomonas tetramitiformis TaxID=36881 RepID=A0AAE0L0S5_9CHLO|nr:hypothetical protein CYMTET_23564 [Cymbomonas tetramitiformis]
MDNDNAEDNQAYVGRVDGGDRLRRAWARKWRGGCFGWVFRWRCSGQESVLGLVGEGPLEERVTVIEYFDGNPARDEVLLEQEPRGPGVHEGHLIRRDDERGVTVEEIARMRGLSVVGCAVNDFPSLMVPDLEAKRLELAKLAPATEETLLKLERLHPAGTAGDANCFADGMPGAGGDLDFIDFLSKLEHAQAQGLLLRFCAHLRLGFWLRGVPSEMKQEASDEHDRRMQEALRDLLLGSGLAWHSCEFATLTHGMSLNKTARGYSSDGLWGDAQPEVGGVGLVEDV